MATKTKKVVVVEGDVTVTASEMIDSTDEEWGEILRSRLLTALEMTGTATIVEYNLVSQDGDSLTFTVSAKVKP